MKIDIKHYVELFLSGDYDFAVVSEIAVQPIADRDPLLLDSDANRKKVIGFRFFDSIEAILGNGEKLTGERKNVSSIFYFGKRIYVQKEEETSSLSKNFFKEKEIKCVIECDCGCYITNPSENSITVDEYKKTLSAKQEEKGKIKQRK